MFFTKKVLMIAMLMLFIGQSRIHAQVKIDSKSLHKLNGTHDLSLPDWGPYTKRYIGISHIPDKNMGIRFDLSIFPGFYRRKVAVPNVLFENEYHPWQASPNLEYFSFRHELEWKDQVYTDISYSKINDKARLIRIDCVNNTIQNQNIALHFMAFFNFPPIKEYSISTPIYPGIISLPKDAIWIDALDYQNLNFSKQRPQDDLVYDGKMRGEVRSDGFVNGSGIGDGFGIDKGDNVSYRIKLDKSYSDASLLIRYKIKKNNELGIKLSGIVNSEIKLKGINDFDSEIIKIGQLKKGDYELNIISDGGSEVEFDGFAISESNLINSITIKRKEWNPAPTITEGPVANSILLKYDDIDIYYGLLWDYDMFEIRQWFNQDLSSYFKQMVNEHVRMIFNGEGDGHFTNVFLKPIDIKPNSTKTLYSVICSGTKSEVEKYLSEMNSSKNKFESIYETAKNHVVDLKPNPDGEKYKFSIEKMNATLACNVVYPVYTQREYIRHSAPGRWWDCLYTWDSGFIGLGLLKTDIWRAVENLNAYVQEPGAQSAFIHHGSPVPVQHYLFFELWNETQSNELLEYFYPRLKQFHEFLAGRLGSSTTRVLKSNLLKTWDYFYNSGGWDDYPPQKYTHLNSLQSNVAPVINTSQAIRTAKILKMAATHLGKVNDVKEYDNDIRMFSDAIQKYSWDEESGYFGYVVHDKSGQPTNILKYKDNVNFNMGLDGAYPLVAGITTEVQKERILNSLKSKDKIWSDIGLSAVDQSAPYYRVDGYWNGTVWMPHQWFFWKTMLDYGESEFAFKIAKTALDLWKNEVEASYNCMEHFLIKTGRGAGWHEFGGLSAPVINWFSAYYRPGNFNAGFNVWIENKRFNENNSGLSIDLTFFDNTNNTTSVVACMNSDFEYVVKWNEKVINYKSVAQGTLSIDIPIKNVTKGKLEIQKK
ncbi:MAG: hypothetical protein KF816_03320 [Melioribacteraceae bacterium]|nr:hypothetical protein [Melioribacteraceae bacterium]